MESASRFNESETVDIAVSELREQSNRSIRIGNRISNLLF